MAQQRWTPGVSRDDFNVSSSLTFRKIDDRRGNGICATETIKKNQTLISEGALLCSVLNKIRFPPSSSPSPSSSSSSNSSSIRYCSMCCCFMGSPKDEIQRLQNLMRERQKEAESSSPVDTQDYVSLLMSSNNNNEDNNDTESLLFGMTKQQLHHLWFAKGIDGHIFEHVRCDRCHVKRCLNPELPQTLEEIGVFLLRSDSANDDDMTITRGSVVSCACLVYRELIELAKNFDEAIFGMSRAVLMLVDEVVGSRALTDVERSQKRGNWVDESITTVPNNTCRTTIGEEAKEECNYRCGVQRKKAGKKKKFQQPRAHWSVSQKSFHWRTRKMISRSRKKLTRDIKVRNRSCYFDPDDLDDFEADEMQNHDTLSADEILDVLSFYSSSVHERINFFCSCFDAGLRPKHSDPDDLKNYRKVTTLLNLLLTHLTQLFLTMNANENSDLVVTKRAFRFISLNQLLTLRCCLQNNQHRSLIPNPLSLVLAESDDDDDDDDQEEKSPSATSIMMNAASAQKLRKTVRKTLFNRQNRLVGQALSRLFKKDHPFLHEDDDFLIEAQALFVNTSRLNHACSPSASVQPALDDRGCCLKVKSLKTIKKNAEIRISYVEVDEVERSKKKVHRYLKKQYGFDCED